MSVTANLQFLSESYFCLSLGFQDQQHLQLHGVRGLSYFRMFARLIHFFLNCWCSLCGINRLSRGHNLLSVWDFRSIKSPSVPTRALRIATQTPATHPPTHPTTHLCKAHMLAHKLKDQLERDMGQLFTGLTVCCHIILLAGSA